MRRIVICGLKPEYIPFVTLIQGWAQQPSLEEFENLLTSQELLAKQLAGVFVNDIEGYALVANKRNFKGKTRDVSHTRSLGGSSLPGKKEEFSNYYAEARAIDAKISINLEGDWIEDLEYNIADHLEKQEVDVDGTKQEIFEDVLSGDRVATIEEIKEEDLEQESIEGDVLEAAVYGQSSAISRAINDPEQILKADGESRDQIEQEAYIEVSKTNDMISEAAKKSIEEMIREYDSGSYVGVETSNEIDSVSLDNIIVENLRERGSLRTQQGDNLYGSTNDEEFYHLKK
ncbi:hypothetical protein KY284_007306 [Solanum tuberosum]|nr:hypothetical protein KY284_007306 [Solanum tuberosum]